MRLIKKMRDWWAEGVSDTISCSFSFTVVLVLVKCVLIVSILYSVAQGINDDVEAFFGYGRGRIVVRGNFGTRV